MFEGFTPFTWFHVALSLVGIFSGLAVMFGLLQSKRLSGWTAVFLITTVLTSATGFGFPFDRFLPSHWTGVISLVVLAVAILGRYVFHYAGAWRWLYAVGIVLGLYFNVFVLVVQLFQKVPALNALAPTQAEPPFAIAQGVVLVVFVAFAIAAALKFRPVALADPTR